MKPDLTAAAEITTLVEKTKNLLEDQRAQRLRIYQQALDDGASIQDLVMLTGFTSGHLYYLGLKKRVTTEAAPAPFEAVDL